MGSCSLYLNHGRDKKIIIHIATLPAKWKVSILSSVISVFTALYPSGYVGMQQCSKTLCSLMHMTAQTTFPCVQHNVQSNSPIFVADLQSTMRMFPFMKGEITATGNQLHILFEIHSSYQFQIIVFLQNECNWHVQQWECFTICRKSSNTNQESIEKIKKKGRKEKC